MKWLSFVALLLSFSASGAGAQWIVPPRTNWLKQGEFHRPRPAHHLAGIRPLSMPSPETPNWLFPNIDITNSPDTGQFEPSITINPKITSNIIVGFIDDISFTALGDGVSFDSGSTWYRHLLPDRADMLSNATDPSVAFDPSGSAFFALGYSNDNNPNAVSIFQSRNEGIDWQQLTDAFYSSGDTTSDKYYIGIDRSPASPFEGRIYIAWVDQGTGSGNVRIVCAHSNDFGVTWSQRRYLSPAGHYIAPVPVTEPDGTLLVAYEDYFPNNIIYVIRSTDGGATFTNPDTIAKYINIGPILPDDSLGYVNIGPPDSAIAVNSFPSVAIEPDGRAYITWCGKGSDNEPHIWLSASNDDGITWSTPRAIETDSVSNPFARFFPWIAVDPASGDVGIAYYVAQMVTVPPKQDGGNLMLQAGLYLAHSHDTGVTFNTRRISSAIFDPITGQDFRDAEGNILWFFGDYIGLAANNELWHPVWCDARSGDADIYSANVSPYAPLPVTDLNAHDTIVDGKPGTILTWIPPTESVFGYPIPPEDYNIIIYNNTTQLTGFGTSKFFDTSASEGHRYVVQVHSRWGSSLPDTVYGGKASVNELIPSPNLKLCFASEPAIAGREDQLFLDCSEVCRITIAFYDELGRAIGPAVSDGIVSTQHEIAFTPNAPGVQFFVMKEISSISSKEITGKISVLR